MPYNVAEPEISSACHVIQAFDKRFTVVHQQVGILVEAKPGCEVDPADPAAVAEFRNAIW